MFKLTIYVLNFSEGTKTFICLLCHSSTLTRQRLFNPSSSKARTYLLHIFNIMGADDLATLGVRLTWDATKREIRVFLIQQAYFIWDWFTYDRGGAWISYYIQVDTALITWLAVPISIPWHREYWTIHLKAHLKPDSIKPSNTPAKPYQLLVCMSLINSLF